MHSRDISIVRREFRSIFKAIDDLDRRAAATMLNGKVAEIDGDRVRLEILPEGAAGKPFLSPWVQVQEAAGATGSHFPVKKGDPMRLLSPNGEVGTRSLAVRDGYTSANPNPTDKKQNELALAYGGASIRLSGGKIQLIGEVEAIGGKLTHNDVNVGETHKHTDVLPGPSLTGPPQA